MTNDLLKVIGNNIKNIRNEKEIKGDTLSKALKKTKSSVSLMENGLTSNDLDASGMMVLDAEDDDGTELIEALERDETTPSTYETFLTSRMCPSQRGDKVIRPFEWATGPVTEPECQANYSLFQSYFIAGKLEYRKAIIVFWIKARAKSHWMCGVGNPVGSAVFPHVDLNIVNSAYTINIRCRGNITATFNKELEDVSRIATTAWHGPRSLSYMSAECYFQIRVHADRNPNGFVTSNIYHIGY